MKNRLTAALLCVLLCKAFLGQTAQSQNADVLLFVKKYDDAWNRKDAVLIQRILAPEYVYFTSKGGVTSRKALINELMSPSYKLASSERSEMKAYITQTTAIVSSRWKGQGSYNGQEFRDDQRCSIVLERDGQDWSVLSEHCTQITGP